MRQNSPYEFPPTARYYNSALSIWLSVDPMSDKYPGMSPYTYCANNPVRLVDVDGREIFVANEKTKGYISKYLTDQFGTDNFIKYSSKNKLKINNKNYQNIYKTANEYQKTLLRGLKKGNWKHFKSHS